MNPEKGPSMPSPEEMAQNEKERTLSDAELLKNGAEYKINEKGEKRLEVTAEQTEKRKESKEIEEVKREVDTLKRSMDVLMDSMYKFTRMLYSSSGKGLDEYSNYSVIFELEGTMKWIKEQIKVPTTDKEYKE